MDMYRSRGCIFLMAAIAGLCLAGECTAAPAAVSTALTMEGYPVLIPVLNENDEPDFLVRYIPDLGKILSLSPDRRVLLHSQQKRGIDFGLGRGYSGSQAARHMLGLQQASFAGGPGKRSDPALS